MPHLPRQLSRVRVLSARMEGAEQDAAVGERRLTAVAKGRPLGGSERIPAGCPEPALARDAAKCQHDAHAGEQRELALEKATAVRQLVARGLVVRGSAAGRRGDVAAGE